METPAAKPDREILTPLERGIEPVVIVLMLLMLTFLIEHQRANTGFFTEKFGSLEMLALYVPIALSFTAPLARAASGRKNPGRPFAALTSLVLAAGSLWLLNVFPFDFAHLGDIGPAPLRFVLGWVTNDIGRLLLILQMIVSPITAVLTFVRFLLVLRREPASPSLRVS